VCVQVEVVVVDLHWLAAERGVDREHVEGKPRVAGWRVGVGVFSMTQRPQAR